MGARWILRWLTAAVLATALVAGCVPTAPPPSPIPPELGLKAQVRALLTLGEGQLLQGRYQEAAASFKQVLALKTDAAQRNQALYGLGRAELGRGNYQEALKWTQSLLESSPDPELEAKGRLLAARVQRRLGNLQQASLELARLTAGPGAALLPQDLRRQARELRSQILGELGRWNEAARELMVLARQPDPQAARQAAEKLSQAAARVSSSELSRLLAGARMPQVRIALMLGMCRSLVREGRLDQAGRVLARLRRLPGVESWQEQLRELEDQLGQARVVNPRSVGVILPLSGPYRAQGQAVLAAVELGLGLFSPGAANNPPILHIEDSKSDPAAAAQAVSRLVQQQRVAAIIGPLGTATSLAAARRAQRLGVPIITLTPVPGVTRAGEFVFQNFITPQEQVQALLRAEMELIGNRRFAVLAPRNTYGKGFTRLFSHEVTRRGGQVVRTVFYDPAKTDFTAEVKALAQLPPGRYRPGRPDSPKPVIDFQALFIPDGARRAGTLASQLAYWDVVGVDLLGTSLWHSPQLLEIGGRYLRRSLFPDAFDPDSKDPVVVRFVHEFYGSLGREPNLLEAHGYDAALLLRTLLQGYQPPRTRRELRDALADLKGVSGVCGRLSVGPRRRVLKELTLFTVRAGAFRPVEDLTTWSQETSPEQPSLTPATPEAQPSPPLPERPAPAATIPR